MIKTVEDLKSIYSKDPRTTEISTELDSRSSRIHLKGLIGSAPALVASAIIEDKKGTHLFILNDKEEAVYFMNDLENLNQGTFKPLFYPSSSRSPYQIEKTENANVSMRAEVLNSISKDKETTVIISFPSAISERVLTKKMLSKNTFHVSVGESFDIEFIDEAFYEFGFEKVDYVFEPGQYAVRGGIVDVFSFSFDHPYRIEFFGDEVESIRKFEPSTQLSVNKLTKATIVPNLRKKIKHESHESFLEFLPNNSIIWARDLDTTNHKIEKNIEKAEKIYNKLDSDLKHLAPIELYLDKSDFQKQLADFKVVEFGSNRYYREGHTIQYSNLPHPSFNKNFELFR